MAQLFYNPVLKVMLVVYVDDFKMAGPIDAVKEAWRLIREVKPTIKMTNPAPVDHYLGCKHDITEVKREGKTCRVMEYNMEAFLKSSCEVYIKLAGPGTTLEQVKTPFIEEDDRENTTRQPATKGVGLTCPWCKCTSDKDSFDIYKQNAKKASPDEPSTEGNPGRLQPIAAKVIMKVF